ESTDPEVNTELGNATATDNCDASVSITHTDDNMQGADPDECSYYNYTITRTFTAEDDFGNSSTCVQVITVHDVTDPTITCPANTTVDCEDASDIGALGNAAASDNCDANVMISHVDDNTQGVDPDACSYYNYTISRTFTAEDACGNTSTCEQVITVHDVTPPTPFCQNITVYLDETGIATITGEDIDNGSSDN